jgi:hypothetical protein
MFKLVKAETPPEEAPSQRHVWSLRVTATYTSDDTAAKIFVMQAGQSMEDPVGDTFSCVASVQQMTEIPADAPSESGPYFRLSQITFYARSEDHAVEAWQKIQEAVRDLARNTVAAQTLADVEEVIITP